MDPVTRVIDHAFSTWKYSEQLRIIEAGRPTPTLQLKTEGAKGGKIFIRHFQQTTYGNYAWLCGSSELSKLFCWPCLLFTSERTTWNTLGYSDLNNFTTSVKRHEKSRSHIAATFRWRTFGNDRMDIEADGQRRQAAVAHNNKVRKNRNVMRRLIDVTCLLGKLDLPFRGPTEPYDPDTRENFTELLEFLSAYDPTISNHLETRSVFPNVSNRTQDDLVHCVSAVVEDGIRKEVEDARFVSILLDETRDGSNKSQLSTMFRYVTGSGEVVERFVEFTECGAGATATVISNYVEEIVHKFNCQQKLIAQSYDGAILLAEDLSFVHKRVKEAFPKAKLIPCRSYELNHVLAQSCQRIEECSSFFQTLNALASFFSQFSRNLSSLDDVLTKKFACICPTPWDVGSHLVNHVHSNYQDLLHYFAFIQGSPSQWDAVTVTMATGLSVALTSFSFVFFLEIFSDVFSYTDILSDTLQGRYLDVSFCINTATECIEMLNKKKDQFEDIWSCSIETNESVSEFRNIRNTKSRNAVPDDAIKEKYWRVFNDVMDTLIVQISTRLSDMESLQFMQLLDVTRFEEYSKSFPDGPFHLLMATYEDTFDAYRFRNELLFIYSSPAFADKSVSEMHLLLRSLNLIDCMPALHLLITLCLTLPCTKPSVDQSCLTLKRVKSYCRSKNEARLQNFSLLSIEKEFMMHLKQNSPSFHDDVIEHFLKKDRKFDLVLK